MILWDEMEVSKEASRAMSCMGRYSGCDIREISSLFSPRFPDGEYRQPLFSPEAARLSLELAATAYDLETDDWREAGWRDFSYQVDNTLLSGPAVNGGSGKSFAGVISDYFQRLAQSRLKRKNPFSQFFGALRQRESSDTCKAVVMLHPAPEGRYIVAIGFMGTGKRIYDWFSNFRLNSEDGAHLGFLQLTRQFENYSDKIYFPETARELGLAQLTLSDILTECRRPNSRFAIWMAGHSQGGAVMQLFSFRAVKNGLLPQHLLGYGFASPSVLYDYPPCDLGCFPLFHVINADDVTPRVGAALHIGRCMVYTPDAEMRRICYHAGLTNPAFLPLLHYIHTIRDSAAAFLSMLAFLHALEKQPDEDIAAMLPNAFSRLLPDKWTASIGGGIDGILRYLIHQTEKGYFLASGRETVPQALLQPLIRRCAQIVSQFGPKLYTQALGTALGLPHKLRGPMEDMRSYQYIVNRHLAELCQKVWLPPVMISEGSPRRAAPRLPGGRFARFSSSKNRWNRTHTHKEAL